MGIDICNFCCAMWLFGFVGIFGEGGKSAILFLVLLGCWLLVDRSSYAFATVYVIPC